MNRAASLSQHGVMKYLSVFVFAALTLPGNATVYGQACEKLTRLSLLNGKVTMAVLVSTGEHTAPALSSIEGLPRFCRVAATLTPSADSRIRIEVWMPASGWNGRFEGTGNGGYAGSISYNALAEGLKAGYATANTDMGTSPSTMENGDPLIGHPERWTDWGWRATHVMTEAAQQIVRAYFGRPAKYSYFVGCSTGGEQALMEAQRFPDDYTGIIAGAPANNRTHLHMDILWNSAAEMSDLSGYIPKAKLPLITRAALDACAKERAVPSDPFFSHDPSSCHWNPQKLLCKSGDGPKCLTADQVATVRKLYNGPVDPTTGRQIYPGIPRGSEFGWTALTPADGEPPFDSLFKWVFGPQWNWRSFDYGHDVVIVDDRLAAALNATNPDLGAFEAHGHKLIVYHGLADWLVAPEESINYFRSVASYQATNGTPHHPNQFRETNQFYRLFLVPGMSHCSGGPGLNTINPLPSLVLWVEKGIAPERIVAKRVESGVTEMTRPVCVYPREVRYLGHGDTTTSTSFACVTPRN